MTNPSLKILIVHCHFERGGVTQVVDNHVHCLRDADEITEIALLSGPRQSGLQESTRNAVQLWSLQSLEYDSHREIKNDIETDARTTAEDIDQLCRQSDWNPNEVVVHWHNHSLGKNAASPLVVKRLAAMGYSCVLHIHDFAEDQRPENWAYLRDTLPCQSATELDTILYPTGPRISYATLTTGDARTLVQYGIDRSRVDVLPNSVRLPSSELPAFETARQKVRQAFDLPSDFQWMLYPVRGIRRKNLGEFLLMCQLAGRPAVGAMTLMPTTPVEKRSYERWRSIAHECVDNVVFDAAHHPDIEFTDNLSAATTVVSSSVAEGFGMAFLEPWLASRSVVARNLPGVTADFIDRGVLLDRLYDSVRIPGSPDWLAGAEQAFQLAKQKAWQGVLTEAELGSQVTQPTAEQHDWIDFARLTPDLQIEVLRKFASDEGFAQEVRQRNRDLVNWLTEPLDPSVIQHNRSIVQSEFGSANQRQQLLNLYRKAVQNADIPVTEATGSRAMLQWVDQSRPFYPCRVERLDT
ncbi:hypothetical protein [Rhodopirellula halodulae]|uniref:hypothetical protein n=1 Tax=Rhodopirellula halodulae TaxID=2894198 RepID=UPI001E61675B|nr:hypothetical protein [Rhodopirellula sp. JC737]MCC9658210.1 hypothetical protein [Rhodopirellula sp. JC737]